MLAACDFNGVRTCDADVACESELTCWRLTQLDGRRGCTMPTPKLPPDGRIRAAKMLIEETVEAFEAWKAGAE